MSVLAPVRLFIRFFCAALQKLKAMSRARRPVAVLRVHTGLLATTAKKWRLGTRAPRNDGQAWSYGFGDEAGEAAGFTETFGGIAAPGGLPCGRVES